MFIDIGRPIADATNSFVDNNATNGTRYFYAVQSVDEDSETSGLSDEVAAIPAATGNQAPAFLTDPVVETNGTVGQGYSASLADNASDPRTRSLCMV